MGSKVAWSKSGLGKGFGGRRGQRGRSSWAAGVALYPKNLCPPKIPFKNS